MSPGGFVLGTHDRLHIVPRSPIADNNGLLLRSDVRTLFDRGYVTVTPAYQLRVSRRLRDDFDNGEHYYQYEKSGLWVPGAAEDRPSKEFLECYADTVFRG